MVDLLLFVFNKSPLVLSIIITFLALISLYLCITQNKVPNKLLDFKIHFCNIFHAQSIPPKLKILFCFIYLIVLVICIKIGFDYIKKDHILKSNDIYEWQWSGQNWFGNMYFKKVNGNLKAYLLVTKCYKTQSENEQAINNNIRVLETIDTIYSKNGDIIEHNNFISFKGLKVKKNEFNCLKINNTNIEGFDVIKTDTVELSCDSLKLFPALIGNLRYKYKNKEEFGDIILVNHFSNLSFQR